MFLLILEDLCVLLAFDENTSGDAASETARNEYNDSSELYSQDKTKPWRIHGEKFTFAQVLKHLPLQLSSCNVMDVACGDGFYSRFLCKLGAQKVVGVDISEQMINLARKKSADFPNLEFLCADACAINISTNYGLFDVVTASYLFNYSPNEERLREFAESIYNNLKPGGYCIGVNTSPYNTENFVVEDSTIGVRMIYQDDPVVEGSTIKITFIEAGGAEFDITNYHLSPETHQKVFNEVGFEEVKWQKLEVSPEGSQKYPDKSKWWPTIPVAVFSMRKPES